MDCKDRYRIGELAELSHMSPRTIDYYTQLGLLQPTERSEGNYRIYGPGALERLQVIKTLQGQRLSLAEIARRLDGVDHFDTDEAPEPDSQWTDVLERMEAIESDLARLQRELGEANLRWVAQHLCEESRQLLARRANDALMRTLALAQFLGGVITEVGPHTY